MWNRTGNCRPLRRHDKGWVAAGHDLSCSFPISPIGC
jgi:hypothetical protein